MKAKGFIDFDALMFILLAGFMGFLFFAMMQTADHNQELIKMCVADGNPVYYCRSLIVGN